MVFYVKQQLGIELERMNLHETEGIECNSIPRIQYILGFSTCANTMMQLKTYASTANKSTRKILILLF